MLGSKLRSWMEAHLVRPRKKQQRKINTRAKTIPEALDEGKQDFEEKEKVKSDGELGGELGSTTGCGGGLIRITREKLRDGPREEPERRREETATLANLSSPESAYSTGYSTDGTSPGASVPPEYYINLRTGTHYVAPGNGAPLTPKSAQRRAMARARPPLPESSTEEDIAADSNHSKPHKPLTPKSQRKLGGVVHRRTESYDECHYRGGIGSPYACPTSHQAVSPCQVTSPLLSPTPHTMVSPPPCHTPRPCPSPRPCGSPRPCPSPRPCESPRPCQSPRPCPSPRPCGSPRPCASPHPSMSPLPGASPRQRNRIRTNPWHPPPLDDLDRKLLHPNTDTADSSSTLSSTDKPNYRTSGNPRPLQQTGVVSRDVVTTCLSSTVPHPCRHHPLSSSSSAPSSGSDRPPNTSDFSDGEDTQEDEDATLNEMLGNSSDLSLGPVNDMEFIDNSLAQEQIFSDSEKRGCNTSHNQQGVNGMSGGTGEVKRRQSSRASRRQRGEGSQASSRASSRSNRRVKRNLSRKSEDISSSSEFVTERTSEKVRPRHHSSRERKFTSDHSPIKYPINGCDKITENRVVNMNKVLIDRLINNQRCGTRSADTTPILKRHGPLDYNGKYLKNPHVSKLISSNSSLMERRPSLEVRSNRNPTEKRRSNSLSAHYQPVPVKNSHDNDGDLKCRQLIREAENILEGYHHVRSIKPDYLSPTLSTRSAIVPSSNNIATEYRPLDNCLNQEIHSQISLLQEKISSPLIKTDNEDGILKTISKTLERIMVRDRKCDKNKNSLKSKKKMCVSDSENNEVNNINLSVEVKDFSLSPSNYRRSNTFVAPTKNLIPSPSFKRPTGRFESGEIDKLRPKIRGVDYIRVTEPSNYSPILPQRVSPYLSPGMRSRRLANCYPETRIYSPPFDSKPPLTTFKSFDLGNQNELASQTCPQSEPVKRKVYVGSSTFGKLQKSLMRNETDQDNNPELDTESLREENASLKEKVAQLRMERLKVEARVKEAQNQIDRLNYSESSSRC